MSRHPRTETLSAYLDGEIGEREAGELERHLAECGECRRRLEGLREVAGGLASLDRARPPRRVGLELQSRLLQSVPPFERDRRLGGRLPRLLFQPAILASLGVVIALVVIVLLFLQALERGGPAQQPVEIGAPAHEATRVLVGQRSFRPVPGGWVEVGLSPAEIESAVAAERGELARQESGGDALGAVLDELAGEVILRLDDGRVVRVLP